MELFATLEQIIQSYLPTDKIELVKRAYVIARDAHEGQFRSSGEPYITHPVAVAGIIAGMKLDHEAVMAALLHDVIEDTPYTEEQLTAEFGQSVAEIVQGVSKLDKLKFRTRQEAQAENFRKMILAMTKDIRVVLIKLADRTHNMRTLGSLRPDKRRRIAKETLEIYTPLAHRLGIEHIKNELEDLCFEAINPHRFQVLQKAVANARKTHQELISQISDEIKHRLEQVGIKAEMRGREKHLYAVYQNMRQNDQRFDSIMDFYAFRVIVDSVDTCYRVLGQVHSLYKPRPGQFRDYIAVPKANGYQSLHTSMIGKKGVPVEVYIRTQEMEQMAEMGVAAHWAYKEHGKNDSTSAQIKAQRWLQSLVELQQSVGNSFEFVESVKSEFFPKEIFVFTPKGRIIELPVGATPVDFAYAVHTDVGSTCVSATVDRKPCALSQVLESGQTIDIITQPNARPNADWLNFVVTANARTKIRNALKQLRADEAIALGRKQLNDALAPTRFDEINEQQIQSLLQELNIAKVEDLLLEIGLGNRLSSQVAQRLLNETTTSRQSTPQQSAVKNLANLHRTYAQCCHPVYGDPIVAFNTPNKGLVIHHAHCANLRNNPLQNHRVELNWDASQSAENFEAELRIEMLNEPMALPNLMAMISAAESNIQSIWTEEQDAKTLYITLLIGVNDAKHLDNVLLRIRGITGVINVVRNVNE